MREFRVESFCGLALVEEWFKVSITWPYSKLDVAGLWYMLPLLTNQRLHSPAGGVPEPS